MIEKKLIVIGITLLFLFSVIGLTVNANAEQTTQTTTQQTIMTSQCNNLGFFSFFCDAIVNSLGVGKQQSVLGALFNSAMMTGIADFGLKKYYEDNLKGRENHSTTITTKPIEITSLNYEKIKSPSGTITPKIEWQGNFQTNYIAQGTELKAFGEKKIEITNIQGKQGKYYGKLKIGTKTKEFKTDLGMQAYGYNAKEQDIITTSTSQERQFRIILNSIKPGKITEPIETETADCISKFKKGKTGEKALPRIKLSWSWQEAIIPENACDSDNTNYIYCDSTQYTISLLKKINKIKEKLENLNLNCKQEEELEECIQRTEKEEETTITGKEEILKLKHYKAYLMADALNKNFQKDFDYYSREQDILGAPTYYKNELWEYFSTPEKMYFTSKYNQELKEFNMIEPGVFNTDIEITFQKNTGKLFEDQEPTTIIKVMLDRSTLKAEKNPLYYMPFNGNIGTKNGRNNYGISYDGEEIYVMEEQGKSVKTISSGHAPSLKTINIEKRQDFKYINNQKRGTILEISNSGAQGKIIMSPSTQNPVVLKVNKETKGNAFAFYAIDVAGEAAQTGSWLLPWTGISIKCKDFSGAIITDAFNETRDNTAIARQCGRTEPLEEGISYGITWCNLSDAAPKGNIYLKTIIYSPQGKTTKLKLGGRSDQATFITNEGENETINFIGGQGIYSIEKVFQLVKENKVCISQTPNSIEFWWNPKTAWDEIKDIEANIKENAKQECIYYK